VSARCPRPFASAAAGRGRAVALLALAVAAVGGAPAGAAERRPSVTLSTGLGPLTDDGDRELRARGRAPDRSRLLVRFYRRGKEIGRARPKVRDGRYRAGVAIGRTGTYVVTLVVRTPRGRTIRLRAKRGYDGPTAKAPAAPPPADPG
jgi:hypothetical protein